MPANFRNSDLQARLRAHAAGGDETARLLVELMAGTLWASITAGVEASDVIRITGQIKDQDGNDVAGAQNVVVETFLASGTALTAVRLATAAALPDCTAAGTGVGHTLTGDANGALSVDSVAVANGDRILVKNQVAGNDNGIYVVTDLGSGGTPFILTRATDFDTAAEMKKGVLIPVTLGTVNTGKTFMHTTSAAITVDTTALTFADFSSPAASDVGAMTVGTVGSIMQGSGTTKVWVQTSAAGAFNLDIKSTQIGSLLVRATTDNGEVEQTLLTFA